MTFRFIPFNIYKMYIKFNESQKEKKNSMDWYNYFQLKRILAAILFEKLYQN